MSWIDHEAPRPPRAPLFTLLTALAAVTGCADDTSSSTSAGDTTDSGSTGGTSAGSTSDGSDSGGADSSGDSVGTTGSTGADSSGGATDTTAGDSSGDDGETGTTGGIDDSHYVVTEGDCELLWTVSGTDESDMQITDVAEYVDIDDDGAGDLITVRTDGATSDVLVRHGADGGPTLTFSVDGNARVLTVLAVDDDGIDDIVVHRSPAADGGGGGPVEPPMGACIVSAHSGADGAMLWERVDPDGGCDSASTADVIPDANADGRDDIVAGWPFPDGIVSTTVGRLLVLDAATGTTLAQYDAPLAAPGYGQRVFNLGDIDDVAGVEIVSDVGWYPSLGDSAITVASLGASSDMWTVTDQMEWFLQAGAVLDANGDGLNDVAATYRERPFPDGTTGLVHVRDASTGEILWQAQSPILEGHFGVGMTAVDDATGDGIQEVAAGGSHALPLPFVGIASAFQILGGADGTVIAEVWDTPDAFTATAFGEALARIGDPTPRNGAALVVLDRNHGDLGTLSAWSCLPE